MCSNNKDLLKFITCQICIVQVIFRARRARLPNHGALHGEFMGKGTVFRGRLVEGRIRCFVVKRKSLYYT